METKKKRNRFQTQQRVLMAVQVVIAQHGLEGVTIHRVSEQSQVSKVLIHRYFGTREAMLEYYVQQGSVFATCNLTQHSLRPLLSCRANPNIWTSQTLHWFRLLRASKANRELLKVSVTQTDSVANLMAQSQHTQYQQLLQQLPGLHELAGKDLEAVFSIILGGLSYLTLLAHQDRSMLGIDLRSEGGWARVEKAVDVLYQALIASRTYPMPS